MVRIVMYLVLCGVLFGAGLGLAIIMGVPTPPEAPPVDLSLVATDLADVVPTNPDSELQLEPTTPVGQLPVPIRGEALTAEELFRFGTMYREQQEALTSRQTEIQRKEARLKLMHDDLLGSRKEFDGLRAQIQDSAARAEQLLLKVRDEKSLLEQQKTDAQNEPQLSQQQETPVSEDEVGNMRKISSWFQAMAPEKAAEHLKRLSNEGKIDSAVQLLGNIEERNAAKILASMEDAGLVVELTEAFRNSKRDSSRAPANLDRRDVRTARRR